MAKPQVGAPPAAANQTATKGYIDAKFLGGIVDITIITTAAYAALVAAGTTVGGRVYLQVN